MSPLEKVTQELERLSIELGLYTSEGQEESVSITAILSLVEMIMAHIQEFPDIRFHEDPDAVRYIFIIRRLLPLCSDYSLIRRLLLLLVRLKDNNPVVLIAIHRNNQHNTIGQIAGEILIEKNLPINYDPNFEAIQGILSSNTHGEARVRCYAFLEQNLGIDPGGAIQSLSSLLSQRLNAEVRKAIVDTIFEMGNIDDREETIISSVDAITNANSPEEVEAIASGLITSHLKSGNFPLVFTTLAMLVIAGENLLESVLDSILDILRANKQFLEILFLPEEQKTMLFAVLSAAEDAQANRWWRSLNDES